MYVGSTTHSFLRFRFAIERLGVNVSILSSKISTDDHLHLQNMLVFLLLMMEAADHRGGS